MDKDGVPPAARVPPTAGVPAEKKLSKPPPSATPEVLSGSESDWEDNMEEQAMDIDPDDDIATSPQAPESLNDAASAAEVAVGLADSPSAAAVDSDEPPTNEQMHKKMMNMIKAQNFPPEEVEIWDKIFGACHV